MCVVIHSPSLVKDKVGEEAEGRSRSCASGACKLLCEGGWGEKKCSFVVSAVWRILDLVRVT